MEPDEFHTEETMNIKDTLKAWFDRHVPLTDGELSRLDVLDGGRASVVQAPAREKVAA